MWSVVPCSDSAVDDTGVAKQDVGDQSCDWSIFVPPLDDAVEPEIKEYMQVQMEEAYAGAVWEKCVGGCGAELKAGGWQVC